MDIIYRIIDYVVNPLILLLVAVAVLYFLFGVFKFVQNADKPDERVKGGQHIVWGLIGLAVIFSVFSLIRFVKNSLGSAATNTTIFP